MMNELFTKQKFNELSAGTIFPFGSLLVRIDKVEDERVSFGVLDQLNKTVKDFKQYDYIAFCKEIGAQNEVSANEPVRHEIFQEVLNWLRLDENVYIYGPAGTGKNVLAKQIADELQVKMFFQNKITDVFEFKGYGDATGRFVSTPFYRAFTEGGLFFLDEMDASCEQAILGLNAALANRYFDFPVIGNVEAHPDFRVIAAGNTAGTGADADYNGRNKMDAACLNRFVVLKMNYDPRIEERCAEGDKEILTFCRELREAVKQAQILLTVSYRNITMLAKARKCFSPEQALQQCVFKGLERDELRILQGAGRFTANRYSDALNNLIWNV